MKPYYIIALMIIMLMTVPSTPGKAQNEADFANFLKAGSADASKLMTAYMEPAVKSMSYGMTGGWYNTAKPHKSLGFDIGVTATFAFIPNSENFFNPESLNLSTTRYNGARPNGSTDPYDPDRKAPTFFGPKDETEYESDYTYDPDGAGGPLPPITQSITYNGPEGLDVKDAIGFAATPVPMIQLGIGVIKNTDIKIRFANSAMAGSVIPNVEFENSEFTIFGVGVMHDIKQHIKGIKMLPFDLSAMVAYNSVTGTIDLSNTDITDERPDSDDGELDYKFNSWVIDALISKKISVLTGYAGFGYSIINTNVDVNGDYVIDSSNPGFVLTDPVAIDYKNNSVRFLIGMRLKFGPIYLNGDYTFQKFNSFTFGIGCAIR